MGRPDADLSSRGCTAHLRGDFKPGEIGGRKITQNLLLGVAVLMGGSDSHGLPIPDVNYPLNRWTNILAATIFLGFNLLGLPTYRSAYDRFLIIVGLGLNVLTIWYAWQWQG